MIETDDDLMFPGDVARLANRTTDAVRMAIREGRLRAIRTARGTHLIHRPDAEGYARAALERDATRQAEESERRTRRAATERREP